MTAFGFVSDRSGEERTIGNATMRTEQPVLAGHQHASKVSGRFAGNNWPLADRPLSGSFRHKADMPVSRVYGALSAGERLRRQVRFQRHR